ncbi:MAG: NAD(+)/NADH kinase [Deltaproteobacteria bacterium]|nr:NAD(+)/NADH kinase [Deltaproteobacteria bacterium]
MKKVGIVVKSDPRARKKAAELERWLTARSVEIVRKKSSPPGHKPSEKNRDLAAADLFCVFVLGGDGTFLSAVRWIGDQHIPIIGIKFGDIGFLAETSEENLLKAAETVLKSNFTVNPRMRLLVQVIRNEKKRVHESVLNDVVINRGALARLANIDTYINDHYLTTYRADGLIVATPTGSTAYSVAAGGPIIHPDVPGIILTPICPFTLTNRPLIVPDSVTIKIRLAGRSPDIMLTLDGQEGLDINDQDTIVIRKGEHPVNMIRLPGQQYYDTLKAKLRWSGGRV